LYETETVTGISGDMDYERGTMVSAEQVARVLRKKGNKWMSVGDLAKELSASKKDVREALSDHRFTRSGGQGNEKYRLR
jgi:hypothetical protein